MASKNQQKYALYGIWKKKWQAANSRPFSGSIHRDAAQLDRIVSDIGYDATKELIEFYFQTKKRDQDLFWFCYNYDKLRDSKLAYEADEKRRAKIREATRKAMEEDR